MLSLQGLCHDYREGERTRRVLDHVELEIAEGEFVAILGRSGSGKSTLFNLISGIDQPRGGAIRMDGRDLSSLNERDRTLFRRRHIGFIYQFFNLLPTLTVRENLLLPLELNGLPPRRADELLEAVALPDRAAAYPDRLSGGEQQRVAIARALVHDPRLVLADEPTGNLDLQTGQRILEMLDRLVREAGKTLVLATHSRAVAERADRVLALVDGRFTQDVDAFAW
ncbi:MAG TPA: ABC transporter ATP-binding protein [Gammaproteobacteria bacterium]|nr:ABC transporter ATP-binding protein [Gammaproteobacteria bacterium]